jgi:hypothetical protein
VRLFGQSVNNSITNCRLICNSGSASIVATKDGATQGEGLMVSNCLLASGDSAFRSNGFLSVGFYNCTCDLLRGIGFDLTAVQAFSFHGPWVYATNACFSWAALSSPTEIGAMISVARAETIGSDHLIYWGANNQGLSIVGGQLILRNGPGFPMVFAGPQASAVGVNVINGTAQTGAFVNALDVHFAAITGDKTVTWLVGP